MDPPPPGSPLSPPARNPTGVCQRWGRVWPLGWPTNCFLPVPYANLSRRGSPAGATPGIFFFGGEALQVQRLEYQQNRLCGSVCVCGCVWLWLWLWLWLRLCVCGCVCLCLCLCLRFCMSVSLGVDVSAAVSAVSVSMAVCLWLCVYGCVSAAVCLRCVSPMYPSGWVCDGGNATGRATTSCVMMWHVCV